MMEAPKEKRYSVFIAGNYVGGVWARTPELAVKRWIRHQPIKHGAESHYSRVTDIWADEVGQAVYS